MLSTVLAIQMEDVLEQIAALPLARRMMYSIAAVVLIRGASLLFERTLTPRFESGDQRYRLRKALKASSYILILTVLTILFADRLKQLGVAFGLVGAGVVVALQDVIASFAGFVAIGFSNLYRVGDRIQVNETKGDVVDISVMRTTIMETGNWVSGDLYNGRIVQIPNSAVLKGMVFNYSQKFRFVWDEISIRLTSESDHWYAREMLLRVGKETVSDYLIEAQHAWKQIVENYRVENPLLEPTVTLQAKSGALEFSLSYIVDYTRRSIVKDELFTKIVNEVASSDGRLEWASLNRHVVRSAAASVRGAANVRRCGRNIQPALTP